MPHPMEPLLDAAKRRQGLHSDQALNRAIGKGNSFASQLRAGKMYPDEASVQALAEAAGLDDDETDTWLLRLRYWRAIKDKEKEVAATYERILKRLGYTVGLLAIFVMALATPQPSSATPAVTYKAPETLYIMNREAR